MSNKNLVIIIAVVLAVIIIAVIFIKGGYSNNQNSSNPPTGTQINEQGAKNQVVIASNSFTPAQVSVKVGDTVTWINNDSYNHTVKSADGLFDSGNIASGTKFSFTFTRAGTFQYSCSIHPFMQGTVVVTQ